MKALYIEPDEEITSVVDRLAAIDDDEVAVVIPRRAGVLQSIINLKLLRFQAEKQQKRVSIVTTDKTGRNLASAVGLTVYQKLPDGGEAADSAVKDTPGTPVPITFKKRPPKQAAKPAATGPTIADIGYKKNAIKDVSAEPVVPMAAAAAKLAEEPKPASAKAAPTAAPEDAPNLLPKFKLLRLSKLNFGRAVVPAAAVKKATTPQRGVPRRLVIAGIAAVVLIAAAAAFLLLPSATVAIQPPSEKLAYEVPVNFSLRAPVADTASNAVPAKVIEVTRDSRKQVTATGTQAGGAKASGELTVINNLSRNQSLIARTRFQAPNGKVFRAQTAINIPAGAQTSVAVVADQGGEDGNLPVGTKLTLPALSGDSVTAQVDKPLVGGSNSATTEISAEDVERAKAELAGQAAKEGLDEARAKLAVGYVLKDTVAATTVLTATADPKVGTAAQAFTISGRVKVTYFTYQESDLNKVLVDDDKAKVPAGVEPVANSRTQVFVATQPSADLLGGVMRTSEQIVKTIDREGLKRQIAGKSPSEAEAILLAAGLSDARIKLSPFWVTAVPKQVGKIKFSLRAVATTPTPTPSGSPAAVTPTPR